VSEALGIPAGGAIPGPEGARVWEMSAVLLLVGASYASVVIAHEPV
jgi:hypothetical protein